MSGARQRLLERTGLTLPTVAATRPSSRLFLLDRTPTDDELLALGAVASAMPGFARRRSRDVDPLRCR